MEDLEALEQSLLDTGQEADSTAVVPASASLHAPLALASGVTASIVPAGGGAASQSSGGRSARTLPCPGCDRILGESMCFICHEETVKWPSILAKGVWCIDCNGCHRTMYIHLMSLPIFQDWLKDAANKDDFRMNLAVLLSYKREKRRRSRVR